jgi:hypothetical protein
MSRANKLSVISSLRSFTASYSIFNIFKVPKCSRFSVDRDNSSPPILGFKPRDALMPRGVVASLATIQCILTLGNFTKILTTIVEGISRDVIPNLTLAWTDNYVMHVDVNPLPRLRLHNATSVIALHSLVPFRVPLPLIQPIKIRSINDSELTLSKRDEGVSFRHAVCLYLTRWRQPYAF